MVDVCVILPAPNLSADKELMRGVVILWAQVKWSSRDLKTTLSHQKQAAPGDGPAPLFIVIPLLKDILGDC